MARARRILVLISVVASGAMGHAYAAGNPACMLLSSEDVAASIGVSAPASPAGADRIAAGPGAGKRIFHCQWGGPRSPAAVSTGLVNDVDDAQGRAALILLSGQFNQLRRVGWRDDPKDFGEIHCSSLTQPKSLHPMQFTGCTGVVRRAALSVVIGDHLHLHTAEEAKKLFDSAVARLPGPRS